MPTPADTRRARRRAPSAPPHPKRTPPPRPAPKPRRLCRCPRDAELRFVSVHDSGRRAYYRLRLPTAAGRRRRYYSAGLFADLTAALFHRRCLLRELGCSLDDASDTIAAALREWLARHPHARRGPGRPRRR